MSEMIERARSAVADLVPEYCDNCDHQLRPDYGDIVRAVLKAMREPTPAMVEAGRYAKIAHTGAADFGQFDNETEAWRAMIDAALADHP